MMVNMGFTGAYWHSVIKGLKEQPAFQ